MWLSLRLYGTLDDDLLLLLLLLLLMLSETSGGHDRLGLLMRHSSHRDTRCAGMYMRFASYNTLSRMQWTTAGVGRLLLLLLLVL
uniref:Putative secreted protein n=1 Tax=Anopheles darlingi TaxID=43151 RepID=A0A2M4DD29_ANODA